MAVVQGVMVALPPPKGYVVDFEHPQRQGVPDAYWVAGVGMFLSLVFMAQRIYTKVFLSGGLRVDDGMLMARCDPFWDGVAKKKKDEHREAKSKLLV